MAPEEVDLLSGVLKPLLGYGVLGIIGAIFLFITFKKYISSERFMNNIMTKIVENNIDDDKKDEIQMQSDIKELIDKINITNRLLAKLNENAIQIKTDILSDIHELTETINGLQISKEEIDKVSNLLRNIKDKMCCIEDFLIEEDKKE